ncbi:MAG: DUF3108 domain-containing protein [Chloracidobacterium sp.]|nr:DUF3108 domain-containing protein [Chloracidobacterium sp.]MDW8216524.1 DUF3108 domain-containing protein [Acidobacteriota bacterium]
MTEYSTTKWSRRRLVVAGCLLAAWPGGLWWTSESGAAQQRPRIVVSPVETATNGSGVKAAPARHRFIVGERLTYSVRVSAPSVGLRDAPVARFSTEVAEQGVFYGREGLRLVVRAETTGFVKATLFDLDDRFVTYLDPTTRLPYRAEADIREGARIERTVTVFDQAKRLARINDERIVKLKGDAYDLAGLLWATRNLDFTGPATVTMLAVNDRNGQVITVEIERVGRETLDIAGRTVPTVKLALRPLDAAGKPSDERKIRLWITDDTDRYAVRISGGNELGEFCAELTRFPSRAAEPE